MVLVSNNHFSQTFRADHLPLEIGFVELERGYTEVFILVDGRVEVQSCPLSV